MSQRPATIAVLIHDHLIRTGKTEAELAAEIGADQAQVSRWRRNAAVPRSSWDDDLAAALGVTPSRIAEAREESDRIRRTEPATAKTDRELLAELRRELRKRDARIARLEAELRRRRQSP